MDFKNNINFVISGEAGQGIESVEKIISTMLFKEGFNTFCVDEYMSRVRGGCNSTLIKVSSEKSPFYSNRIDVLFMLNEKALDHLKNSITDKTIVIDSKKSNIYAAGYICGLFNLDCEKSLEFLKTQFSPKIFESQKNIEAFKNGQNDAQNSDIKVEIQRDEALKSEKLFSGNDALGFGAIAGGANFLAFYPMSPSTNFSNFLTKYSDDFNIISEQAEDEISAINMSIGASYAGARACVSTSGGGFALMCEGVSLAGMIETPIVIHLAQRPAPATGLPTRTAQEDLNLALYSGHGEFARIIFAPSTFEDTFLIAYRAFDLAQKYQVPVFILTEQSFLESIFAVKPFNIEGIENKNYFIPSSVDYKRYRLGDSSVSPMAIPGLGEGIVSVDSDEHDEEGYITEDFELRKLMVDKRLKKLDLIKDDVLQPYFVGNPDYENLIISWGANFYVINEAIKNRKNFALLHFNQIYPLVNEEKILEYTKKTKKLIIIERNATGQFARLLRSEFGIVFDNSLLKYDGMPFGIEEIERFLDEI